VAVPPSLAPPVALVTHAKALGRGGGAFVAVVTNARALGVYRGSGGGGKGGGGGDSGGGGGGGCGGGGGSGGSNSSGAAAAAPLGSDAGVTGLVYSRRGTHIGNGRKQSRRLHRRRRVCQPLTRLRGRAWQKLLAYCNPFANPRFLSRVSPFLCFEHVLAGRRRGRPPARAPSTTCRGPRLRRRNG
jgi:hypothetical protein